jgi:hypothetical protein
MMEKLIQQFDAAITVTSLTTVLSEETYFLSFYSVNRNYINIYMDQILKDT